MNLFKKLQIDSVILLLALIVVISLVLVSFIATSEFIESRIWVKHTNTVIAKINELEVNIQQADKSHLLAILTNNEEYFVQYIVISNTFIQQAIALDQLVSDNPIQKKRASALLAASDKLAAIKYRSLPNQKKQLANRAGSLDPIFAISHQMLDILTQMLAEEQKLLNIRYDNSNHLLEQLKLTFIILVVAFSILAAMGYVLYRNANLKQIDFQKSLMSSQSLAQANLQNISIMSEMSNLLLACRDTTESFGVIAHFAKKIIQSDAGAMYLYWESRNQLERKAEWGEKLESQLVFEPSTCWALRRGQMHVYDHALDTIPCNHITEHAQVSTICIPISAQGIVQGAIYFQRSHLSSFIESEQQLLSNFSSQIALALANMRLKETLKDQTVRDTLTGLFNRRFMEENLQQIISNAERKNTQFGIVMLDIDHFKQFNDRHGHDAGDAILREIGQLLKNTMRGSDTACRYGGEEFVLIFPESTLAFVEKRCAELLKKIEALNIQYLGNPLGILTASIGIVIYPTHGTNVEVLIRAADTALYEAKASGRNQLKIANLT